MKSRTAEEGMPSASGLLRFNEVMLAIITIYSFLSPGPQRGLVLFRTGGVESYYQYFTKGEPMSKISPKIGVRAYARTPIFGPFQVIS
jgi:hypothetical protein